MTEHASNNPNRQEAFLEKAGEHSRHVRGSLHARGLERFADDAIQNALLKTYTLLGDPACNIEKPAAYMARIAYREALLMWRRGSRYEALGAFREPHIDPFDRWGCDELKPVTSEAVLEALCALPEWISEVFVAWLWDGLSEKALAKKLGITCYRLHQLLLEVRQSVMAWLREHGYDIPEASDCA